MNISQDAVEPAFHLHNTPRYPDPEIQTGARPIKVPEWGSISEGAGTEPSRMSLTKRSSYHAKNVKPYAIQV
jgi:hypothetical protein